MMDKPVETPIEELLRGAFLDRMVTHGDLMERAAEELARLREELKYAKVEAARFKEEHQGACHLVAQMHAAAVGEVTGPNRGVVEDVEDLRLSRDQWKEKWELSERARRDCEAELAVYQKHEQALAQELLVQQKRVEIARKLRASRTSAISSAFPSTSAGRLIRGAISSAWATENPQGDSPQTLAPKGAHKEK